jgi:hypothetical protein
MQTAREATKLHIQRVAQLMASAARQLMERGENHDRSKFDKEELIPLQKMQDLINAEGQAEYGTPEYKRRTDLLGEMTAHHYANNSHHPQHYINGVNGMDLFDVIEMFFDWKAAGERGGESCMNLSESFRRFGFSSQLTSIFQNTARSQGFKHK